MEIQRLFFFSSYFFLLSLVIGNQCVEGSSNDLLLLRSCKVDDFQPKKLFVFGDSYADTGNTNKSTSNAWKFPYGITFPGRPGGRFSSGHIFPEYLAKCLGLTVSPIPYEQRKIGQTKRWRYGMNFAYGGSGVFETLASYPNMSRQIDFFQDLIDDGTVYNKSDLDSSLALVTISGNDYNAYLANNDPILGLPFFIIEVVDQLAKNLKRIHEMGMKKIAVAAIQPLGCLPGRTAASSYEKCSDIQNLGAVFHNALLEYHVQKLNNDAEDSSAFVILDLYDAFLSVINGDSQGSVKFETPLKPCCMGVNSSYSCSEMEDNEKMYELCENPEAAFFWDDFHPTQAGWGAVFSALYPTLQQIS